MNSRSIRFSLLILALMPVQLARAETPVNVQIEINFLLGYVEGSGCLFYRNGVWHDSKAAQAHLRDKYKYLATANQINRSEDFIEKAATRSSLSGLAYEVKCNGGATQASGQWLRAELDRFRTY